MHSTPSLGNFSNIAIKTVPVFSDITDMLQTKLQQKYFLTLQAHCIENCNKNIFWHCRHTAREIVYKTADMLHQQQQNLLDIFWHCSKLPTHICRSVFWHCKTRCRWSCSRNIVWCCGHCRQIYRKKFCAFADALRTELQHKLELELENIRKSHGAELRTARMELERAVEISKQKVCQLLPPPPPYLPQSYLFHIVFTRILCAVTEIIAETIFILLAA